MTKEMTAGHVSFQNDGAIVTVGFADKEDHAKEFILLQRTLSPTRDDKARKWDDIHIMVCDESRSAYGGVKAIELWANHVLITLSPETAVQVQCGPAVFITLTTRVTPIAKLHNMLEVLCGSYAKVTVRS